MFCKVLLVFSLMCGRTVGLVYSPDSCGYAYSTPHPVTVTTRIITFLIGNPYKPSFVTVTGWGVDLIYIYISQTTVVVFSPVNVG